MGADDPLRAAERERLRQIADEESTETQGRAMTKGGRPPRGTGAHTIFVGESNRSSWRLVIGKELWRAIGSPRRVTLERRGMALHIAPLDEQELDEDEPIGYAVSGGGPLSAARISIGRLVAHGEYGLTQRLYELCQVRGGEIVVFL